VRDVQLQVTMQVVNQNAMQPPWRCRTETCRHRSKKKFLST